MNIYCYSLKIQMLTYIYFEMLIVYSKIIELYRNHKYIHKYSIWKKFK